MLPVWKKDNQKPPKNKNRKAKIMAAQAFYFLLFAFRFLLFTFYFLFFAFCFLLSACSHNPDSGKTSSVKFKQYYVHGQQLYLKHCSNCHQSNGSGLGRVYPPLNTSDFMENNFEEVICLIRYGKSGELIVNGLQFNQPMQGIRALSDLEIAEIATYIYNTWEHERGIVEVKEAARILVTCPPSH